MVTITFSEAVTDFDNDDVTVAGGTLGTLTTGDGGVTWTATFTATDGFENTGSVTVDAAATPTRSATSAGPAARHGGDRHREPDGDGGTSPMRALSDSDNSSLVTITFSEAVTDFDNADVTVAGGTLGTLTTATAA